jgi:endogenous inhibitor of DNA gyrase (YacG/DUF329 family)
MRAPKRAAIVEGAEKGKNGGESPQGFVNQRSAAMISCPVCKNKIDPDKPPRSMPFCSDRCRNVDLSRWLIEEYGLPWELGDEDLLDGEDRLDGDASQTDPVRKSSFYD